MLFRLLVLCTLAVQIYCNGCYIDWFRIEDSKPNHLGCLDSEGIMHNSDTEWEKGTANCVCASFGSICCHRYGIDVNPEFGAFNSNDGLQE